MKIHDVIEGLAAKPTLVWGDPQTTVTDVVDDSRLSSKGCLFVARPGAKTDGRQFIAQAVAAGAAAVLTQDVSSVPKHIAAMTASDLPLATASIAERFHGNPSSRLTLIGITGTNGKTTSAYLIRQLLGNSGVKCGLIGTVQIDDGARTFAAELTTPGAVELSRLMRTMVENGCGACVMEASSHALHQKRTAGLSFRVGVFTNLTGDHLDYHQTMEAYLDAKAILFESLPPPPDGFAIVNADADASAHLAGRTPASVITCSTTSRAKTNCWARIGHQAFSHTETMFGGPWGEFECRLPLIGHHNVANALQALATCSALGIDGRTLRTGIASCSAPPGRLEPVTDSSHPFAVLVDYAHTDDALANVLRALRPIVPEGGRLHVVFGCGGDRDRTKRPRMAKVACEFADDVIITSDNPRTEDPEAIIDQVEAGVPSEKRASVRRVADRAAAITEAVATLGDGDILLIAGKGHEDYQIIGTTKRPFDDRKVAAAALDGRSGRVLIA